MEAAGHEDRDHHEQRPDQDRRGLVAGAGPVVGRLHRRPGEDRGQRDADPEQRAAEQPAGLGRRRAPRPRRAGGGGCRGRGRRGPRGAHRFLPSRTSVTAAAATHHGSVCHQVSTSSAGPALPAEELRGTRPQQRHRRGHGDVPVDREPGGDRDPGGGQRQQRSRGRPRRPGSTSATSSHTGSATAPTRASRRARRWNREIGTAASRAAAGSRNEKTSTAAIVAAPSDEDGAGRTVQQPQGGGDRQQHPADGQQRGPGDRPGRGVASPGAGPARSSSAPGRSAASSR